jgi:hypothetical protein
MNGDRSISMKLPAQSPATDRTAAVENVCPECGHQFKGNGFDGIEYPSGGPRIHTAMAPIVENDV